MNSFTRWSTALHESAHLVAAARLLHVDARAYVWGDGERGATCAAIPRTLSTFIEAVAVFCGDVAGNLLAARHAPPDPPRGDPATPPPGDPDDGLLPTNLGDGPSDDERLAEWYRVGGSPAELADCAETFVREHEVEIVRRASALFTSGLTSTERKMPMSTRFEQVAAAKAARARADFIDGCWDGFPDEPLLELAQAAGMTLPAAETIHTRIAQAKHDKLLIPRLPALERHLAELERKYEDANTRMNEAITKIGIEGTKVADQLAAAKLARDEALDAQLRIQRLQADGLMPESTVT